MCEWIAEIHVWPHSTGRGQQVDQKDAGERVQKITLRADGIQAALRMAEVFAKGIETNPMVWQAPIFGVTRSGP